MAGTVADYANRYAGQRFTIVGKGPTRFAYENLREIDGPIIFINDAVQFERFASPGVPSFFFAHDQAQAVWLTPDLRSVAVLPLRGSASSSGQPMISLESLGAAMRAPRCVTYDWRNDWRETPDDAERLCDREQTAKALYLATGTIHSAIHFAWLAGASCIRFIGCDGIGKRYDQRINIESRASPLGVFGKIKARQVWLCDALGLQSEYLNEPSTIAAIPARAHFVWLGADVPHWVRDNVDAFKSLHPDWRVTLWREPQPDMPADLLRLIADAPQLCTQKDIIAYWLLWTRGGLFLDADMVPLRNCDPLRRYRGFACRQHDGRVNCAAMGATVANATIGNIVAAIRAPSNDPHRTKYGPRLLTRLFGKTGNGTDDFAILPMHYFYALIDQKQAHPWWKAGPMAREKMMTEALVNASDATAPYAVHLWGVGGSSKREPYGHGDALVYRLKALFGNVPITGAEIGVLAGRLSEHLLRLLPNLYLSMVDRWCQADQNSKYAKSMGQVGAKTDAEMAQCKAHAEERTGFARERRRLIKSDSVAAADLFEDGTLDFVFIDGDHTYEGVKRDIEAWAPKVRDGGIVAGHDIDTPLGGGDWGVRQAVEEYMTREKIGAALEVGNKYTWFYQKG
jgi:hypothetical protein